MKDNAPTQNRRLEDLLTADETSTERPRDIDVRWLRRRMHLTQNEFAGCFGFPVATLLHVIRDNPRAVLEAVRKARKAWPGSFPEVKPSRSNRAPPGMAVGV